MNTEKAEMTLYNYFFYKIGLDFCKIGMILFLLIILSLSLHRFLKFINVD